MNRWKIFLAALAGSAVLAVGFAAGVDRLVTSGPQTPHLKSISDATLSSRYGLTLAAAAQPPYCGLEQKVARADWLSTFLRPVTPSSGAAGCPISRDQAEAAAVGNGSGRVIESVLARVSSTWNPQLRNRLAWLVVVRGSYYRSLQGLACGVIVYPNTAAGPASACYGARWTSDRIAVVDAYSRQPVQTQQPLVGPVVSQAQPQRG